MNLVKVLGLVALFIAPSLARADWTCSIGIYSATGSIEQIARDGIYSQCTLQNSGDDSGCMILANGANCQDNGE